LARYDIDDPVFLEEYGVIGVYPTIDDRPLPPLAASWLQFLLRETELRFDLGHCLSAYRLCGSWLLLSALDQQCVGADINADGRDGKSKQREEGAELHDDDFSRQLGWWPIEYTTKNRPEAAFAALNIIISTLPSFEARVGFADYEDLAAAPDHLAVAVTSLGGLQRGQNFHGTYLNESIVAVNISAALRGTRTRYRAAPQSPAL
jgi:hypothetical protein